GLGFLTALEKENRAISHLNVTMGTSGTSYDGGVALTKFNGTPVVWDPTFERLDEEYGPLATPWTNRAYMLNSRTLRLRPISGAWMQLRKPKRMHDRYVHFNAMTSKYA